MPYLKGSVNNTDASPGALEEDEGLIRGVAAGTGVDRLKGCLNNKPKELQAPAGQAAGKLQRTC